MVYTGLPKDAGVAAGVLADAGFDAEGSTIEMSGDMADDTFCTSVVKTTVERFGKVDHLVNNVSAGLHTWVCGLLAPVRAVDSHTKQTEAVQLSLLARMPLCAHYTYCVSVAARV